jgi:hypothetical protein
MVTIYLRDGGKAEVPAAATVKTVQDHELPAGPVPMLSCDGPDGQRVAYFKWSEVAGYAVSPAKAGVTVESPSIPQV